MKTHFIALGFVVAATAATAQLAAQIDAQPVEAAVPAAERPAVRHSTHSVLHADRERVKADKERLKRARAARDDEAIRSAQPALRADMAAWHADRERLKR
jgi:hypothetical protein